MPQLSSLKPIAKAQTCPIESLDQLLSLLTRLGYHVEPSKIESPSAWSLCPEDKVQLHHLGGLSPRCAFQLILAEHKKASPDLTAWQGRWAGRVWRRDRTFRGLLISATPAWGEVLISLVYPNGLSERPGVHHLRLSSTQRSPATMERLNRLQVKADDTGPEALTRRLADHLDLVHLTRAFYRRFRRCHQQLSTAWVGLDEDVTDEERSTLSLLCLSRLLFLYFLERKLLLDGRGDFLHFERLKVDGDSRRRIFRDLLRPLFFEILNTPPDARSTAALAMGDLPYLNGGLFEPSRLERRCPELDIHDDDLRVVFDDLLDRFNFTIREDGKGVGVDPEMLGLVFEGLMDAGLRGESGTFFTPRALVDVVVERSLSSQLQRYGLSPEEASSLLAGTLHATPARAAELRRRLDTITVLDPACGSGAFLICVLSRLESMHVHLASLAKQGQPRDVKRKIVRNNLFGVDINPAATSLCELRIWLAILNDARVGVAIAPLLNLNHLIRQGDALLEPIDWSLSHKALVIKRDAVESISALKQRYAVAVAERKAALFIELRAAEQALFEALVFSQLQRHRERLQQISATSEALDLFGEPRALSGALMKERIGIERDLIELERHLERVRDDGVSPGFSPAVHFPEVVAAGGFDLIVGNPPWVRIHAIPEMARARLKRRFKAVKDSAWTAGGMLSHLKGFGSQVDLSICFVERSVELLKDGGVLGFWLPSKLLRALYAGGFRKLMMTLAHPTTLIELDSNPFPGATTYPCALVACKRAPCLDASVTIASSLEHPGEPSLLSDLRWDRDDLTSPWILADVNSPNIARESRLGLHPGLKICRGVMTGFNRAFVVDDVTLDTPEADHLPLLRGSHIRAWTWRSTSQILWTHDRTRGLPLERLPKSVEETLLPHRKNLELRADFRGGPWWRIFRTSAHLFSPKVVWRDLGHHLEAVAIPASVGSGASQLPVIPLNTVYFIPTPDFDHALILAAWLNSTPVRRLAKSIAERAASGFRRYFSWVISLLPLPEGIRCAFDACPSVRECAFEGSPSLTPLLELSRRLHAGEEVVDHQKQLDLLILDLYGGAL